MFQKRVNQVSLVIAVTFLILAAFSKNLWLVLAGIGMIIYSFVRIDKQNGD